MLNQHPSQQQQSESGGMTSVTHRGDVSNVHSDQTLPEGDILSCVVYAKPGMGSQVAAVLSDFPGTQVHCGAEVDKLVVTIEDVAGQPAAERLGSLNQIDGVINTILIYHFGGQALASPSPNTAAG